MKRSDSAWAVLLGGSSAIAASNPLTQNDLFWHLALGRGVVTTGSRVVPEPWAIFGAERTRIAPEWLWEITLYGLERHFGMLGIHVLVLLCASLLGLVLVWLMRDVADEHHAALTPLLPVGALGIAAINSRINERPETLAIVLLATTLVLARKFARASGADALRLGALLVLVEVLHAQVHGTFVLVPILIGCASIERLLRRDPTFAKPLAFTALGLFLGGLTSPYGLDVRGYVLSHTHGDAVRHIIDMNSPSWSSVNPADRPYFGYYFALLAIGAVLAAARRRVSLSALLCALLGCALLATALRAVGIAALLALPLAFEGAAGLVTGRRFSRPQTTTLAAVAALICLGDLALNDGKGESRLFRLGFDFDRVPAAGARFLRSRLEGSRVLASFASAAPLSYLTQGRAHVLMDSRTPLHFDDAQYALLRDSFRSVQQLEKAAHWFGITAVVVRQRQTECDVVAQSKLFSAVVVEWGHTTFLRRDPEHPMRALSVLEPCASKGRIKQDRCGREFTEDFERDLKQTGWSGQHFIGLVRAERALRCGPTANDIQALPGWLNADVPESERRPEQLFWFAVALARIGQTDIALTMLSRLALNGDVSAADAMAVPLSRLPPDRVRVLLEPIASQYEDALPPSLRLALARACVATQDLECARFHGLRAFLGSGDEALPIVRWISERIPDSAEDDLLQRALRIRTAPASP